jgi:hypothetical protein
MLRIPAPPECTYQPGRTKAAVSNNHRSTVQTGFTESNKKKFEINDNKTQ